MNTTITAFMVAGCLVSLPFQTAQAQSVSHLTTIQQTHALRVCTTGDYKPYTFYKQAEQRFDGIDIELARALADKLGAKPVFIKTSWPQLMNDFLTRCDIAVGGVSITPERQSQADFSNVTALSGKTPISRCDMTARFQTIDQIDRPNTRVIVNPGGTNQHFAQQHFQHAQVTVYPDNVTIFEQILNGHADVMVTDVEETLLQQKNHAGKLCAIHPDQPFTHSSKAIMLPKGDTAMINTVNQWLSEPATVARIQQLRQQYLGEAR